MLNYQPKNMLVTGGAGFIGANFIRHLLTHHREINIINLDKLTYAGSLANLQHLPNENHYHFIQGDILDGILMQDILQHHCIDTIVHFAAESHVDRSIAKPATFVETNAMGTFVLLETARHYWLEVKKYEAQACRFHHVSTDEVYGSLDLTAAKFTENNPYQPRSPYAATKAASDHFVKAYHHTYGLPITISHCSNNYGPYQHAEKFIPTIIRACQHFKPIPIYGNGHHIRDWLYVEDHCRALMKIIQYGRNGESYDIGGNNEWENLALARYICLQMDALKPAHESYTSLLAFVPDRLGHDFRYAIDSTKIKTELQFIPHETFESGIAKTLEFYISKIF